MPNLGKYLDRTEPHLRTVQIIADRYRKPEPISAAYKLVAAVVVALAIFAALYAPVAINGAILSATL